MQTVYFLGGGNMATAIATGLLKSRQYHIHIAERHAPRREILKNIEGLTVSENLPTLGAQDILLLAVKPQDLQAACANIECNGALVLSIAAGLSIATLEKWLKHRRIVRMMPNLPAQVGKGITGIYALPHINQEDRQCSETIMQTVGSTIWLDDEAQIHAITAIAGSGPGYIFYLLDAFFQAAINQGFSAEQARQLVSNTTQGALSLANERQAPFAQLQAEVTSKGGTTAAALAVFAEQHTADIFQQAVQACAQRSEELGIALSESTL